MAAMFSDLLGTLHVNVRIIAELEHLQTALMLAQASLSFPTH